MAAALLGFTPNYIRRLCGEGKIKAEKVGHDWLFEEKAIKNIRRQRKKKESKE
jgi:excisionase family DNA binding protein